MDSLQRGLLVSGILLSCLLTCACSHDISDEVVGVYYPGEPCGSTVPYRLVRVSLNGDETAVVISSEDTVRGSWEAYDDGDHAICKVLVNNVRAYEFYVGYDKLKKNVVLTPFSPMEYSSYKCTTLYRQ